MSILKKVEIEYYSKNGEDSLWDIAGDFCIDSKPEIIDLTKSNDGNQVKKKRKINDNDEESDSATIPMTEYSDASDAEDTSESQEEENTCWGCREEQPNQLAHMDPGGCLYIPSDNEDSSGDEENTVLKSDKN